MELFVSLKPHHLVLAAIAAVIALDSLYLRRRRRPLSGLFYFCFAFASLGCAALLLNVQALWWASEAKSWTPGLGVVTAAESSSWRTRLETLTSFDLRYRYSVEGIEYEGWRFWPGGEAGRRALDYAVGDEVEVFYDPRRPQRAMLETGYPPSRFIMTLAFSLFVMIPAVSSTWTWWSQRRADRGEVVSRTR